MPSFSIVGTGTFLNRNKLSNFRFVGNPFTWDKQIARLGRSANISLLERDNDRGVANIKWRIHPYKMETLLLQYIYIYIYI
jgi:hypothetical protein